MVPTCAEYKGCNTGCVAGSRCVVRGCNNFTDSGGRPGNRGRSLLTACLLSNVEDKDYSMRCGRGLPCRIGDSMTEDVPDLNRVYVSGNIVA